MAKVQKEQTSRFPEITDPKRAVGRWSRHQDVRMFFNLASAGVNCHEGNLHGGHLAVAIEL